MSIETIPFAEDIRSAVEVMRRGGTIIYPTDTVWGIGCDATDSAAVRKIFEVKQRADSKAMLSLVASEAMLERWVADIPDVAWQLLDVAVRPLTIVFDHPAGLAPEMLAPDGSAGFRLTREKYSSELCRRLGRPVVSTSVNISGCAPAASFADIPAELLDAVDYVAHYRRDETVAAAPSNVIKLSGSGEVTVIR